MDYQNLHADQNAKTHPKSGKTRSFTEIRLFDIYFISWRDNSTSVLFTRK